MNPEIKIIEIVLGVIVFTATTFIGLTVFMKNPKSWTHRLFLMIAAYIDIYTVSNFLSLHPPLGTPENQLFWIRMVMFFSAFLGPLLVFFAVTFPNIKFRMQKKYLISILLLMIVTAAISLTPLVFKGVGYPNGEPVPIPGPAIALYFVDFIALIALSLIIMVWKYRIASGVERARQAALLFGMVVSFSALAAFTFIFVVFLKTSLTVFLGPAFLLALLASIAYAIARHRFLDIQPIVARGVSFIILISLLAGFYATILLLLVNRFVPINLNLFFMFLILLVITAVSFQPLERTTRRITNRIFFTAHYDSDALLSELTHIMAETIDLGDIVNRLLETLLREMNISKGAFLIVKDHIITDTLGIGYADHAFAVPQLEELFHQANGAFPYFLFEDLEEGRFKQIFRKLDIFIVIPIKVENTEVALLVLGGKKSGEIYYERDMEFLDTFASEAGIAIQNAQAYNEIKKFSKELEQRVKERTKQLESAQARELAEARNVARLKDEFVFIAAHELRTPVAAIRGFLELVSSSSVKFPKDIKENLNAIASASGILNQLVGDLLEIARSESGTTKISVSPTNVIPIIKSVIGEMRPLAAQRKVEIRFESPKTAPRALVDPKKVREVIMNLISNGIKYNKTGGTLDISVSSQKSKLAMKFKDTGYGIPKDQQEKIFEKFFRARVKGTQEVSGTGLGLFIVRMLVEKMNGQTTFNSTEGKGSVFSVSFPATTK